MLKMSGRLQLRHEKMEESFWSHEISARFFIFIFYYYTSEPQIKTTEFSFLFILVYWLVLSFILSKWFRINRKHTTRHICILYPSSKRKLKFPEIPNAPTDTYSIKQVHVLGQKVHVQKIWDGSSNSPYN